jgi:hypothetical protein
VHSCVSEGVLQKFFNDTHLEPSGGTAEENKAYCFKLNTPAPDSDTDSETYEFGTPMRPGARSDLRLAEPGALIVNGPSSGHTP